MDGERRNRKVEVVPNSAIRLNYGEGEDDHLMISASHDLIVRFVEAQYNYLRYYDPGTMQIIAVFLGHDVLADLMDEGIPVTKIREKITEGEMEAYEHHLGKLAIAAQGMIEVEEFDPGTPPVPLELMPGDPIDAQIQSATANLDAELDYLFGHGGIEDL